jgi:signal transduction histidine kinase
VLPRAGALAALAAWLLVRELTQPFGFHLPGYAIECVVFGGAWLLGEFVRAQRLVAGQLAERAALLDRERAAREREAAQAERLRIARELHDVIAHHLTVIVIQAQAAGVALGGGGAARDALDAIEASGREALTEMRRTLGLLRRDDHEAAAVAEDRAPQPGLDALAPLVAQLARAGLDVAVTVEGEPRALPRAVDLSAYRIVQEALTNSLRHAGGGHAAVRVRYAADRLELEVTDGGSDSVRSASAAGGRAEHAGGVGQVGMRERVALLGGELTLGPRDEGGYRVCVSLPLTGAPP